MANGSKIRGIDGIIRVTYAGVTAEIPCLTNWTLDASSNSSTEDSLCMASNGDGGSALEGSMVTSRFSGVTDYTLSAEYFWQKDQAAGTTSILGITKTNMDFDLELFPRLNQSGEIKYVGSFKLDTYNITSETSTMIKASVSFGVNGSFAEVVIP